MVPFRGDSEWEVLQKHENATPDWPGELLPQHRRALEQCLAKDPNARFTRVEELVAALGVAVDTTRVVPASTAAPMASSAHAAAGRQQPPPLPSRRPSAVPPPLPSARSEVAWVKAPAELQPPPLPAAQSEALDAPSPPPSGVASSATPADLVPPPLPRSGRRRGSWALALVPSVLVLFAIFLFVGQSGDRSRREGRRAAARSHAQQRAVAGPASIRERVDRFVKSAQRRMKSASQGRRRTTMKDLHLDRVDAPRNLRNYIDMVERLAEAPRFSSGHATKLALHGRPIFLAAVARLQQLDYRDGDDCRAAAHMTSLLAQITGLTGLRVTWDGCDPSRSEISRFQTNADAWRRLAEEFAKTDRDYTRLVAVKGRGRG
ncbi:MAG: hypothetical protein NXI31_26530 [bacterium]|nr:hypothetical protein [bacterium]